MQDSQPEPPKQAPQAPQTPPALSEFVIDVDIDGTDETVATRNANRSVAGAHYTREDRVASKGKMKEKHILHLCCKYCKSAYQAPSTGNIDIS